MNTFFGRTRGGESASHQQLKSVLVTATALATLLSVTFTAAAAQPGAVSTAPSRVAPAACARLQAQDVYWVTLTDSGDIDETVESYPDGTSKVTAAFDYNCIPKKTKLSIVWSIDGEQAFTDTATPKVTDKASTYSYSLYMKDESALTAGDYAVEFYLGETLLSTGHVTVGDLGLKDVTSDTVMTNTGESASVTVQGTVVDSKSKRPINAALVIVLNEGVDPEQWLKDGTDADIIAYAKTDGKGRFELDNPVPATVTLPWIVGAKGYKTIIDSAVTIEESTDDPYIMDITLERSK